ncbi:MAG: hypothetical protein ACI4RP_07155 [Acutalibacteraceae bacterium]
MRWYSLFCIYTRHSSVRASPHQSPEGDSFPTKGKPKLVIN